MSDPIVVPISTPGGAEAAAVTRRFGQSLGAAAAMTDKLAAATAKAVPAVHAEEAATRQSTQQHEKHTLVLRTEAEEIARLEHREQQLAITRKARQKLGESYNAQDITALRRGTRSLSEFGGMAGILGRGAVEGVEGFQGGGLKSTVGAVGVGMVGGLIAFETIHALFESIKENAEFELTIRKEIVDNLREAQRKAAASGASGQSADGAALKQLAALGGQNLVDVARQREKDGQPGAIRAMASIGSRFGIGSQSGLLYRYAQRLSALRGTDIDAEAGKITPGMAQDVLARGGTDALAYTLSRPGHRLSQDDVLHMEWNQANTATVAQLKSNDIDRGRLNDANIGNLPAVGGELKGSLADARSPATAQLITANQGNFSADAKTKAAWDTYQKTGAFSSIHGGIDNALITAYDWWTHGPTRSLQEKAERDQALGDALAPTTAAPQRSAAAHLRAAADALDRGSGTTRRPGQATGSMQ